jgi:pantothenate kinase
VPNVSGLSASEPVEYEADLAELIEDARRLAADGKRRILGLTGAPGAGKSQLAAALVGALAPTAVLVPMDGFHLANAELVRLGRRDRKGAIDTFDAGGYVALLRRLRDPAEDVVYAPEFRRDIEEPVACAIPVPRDVPLVVTEGNYLLVDQGPWAALVELIDEVWYLDPGEDARVERLIARHMAYGKPRDVARAWSLGTDQRNAELVSATRRRADRLIRLASGVLPVDTNP